MDKYRREAKEDLLRRVWVAQEQGHSYTCSSQNSVNGIEDCSVADELVADGHLESDGDGLKITAKGEKWASIVIRRKRLAERLYSDIFGGSEDAVAEFACRLEHIVSEEITDTICTLLGHPPTSPSGRRIPPGACCRHAQKQVRSIVKPLTEFTPGDELRITYMSPSIHKRLDRLNSFGVLPGVEVQLHQKTPTYVIRAGATEVALEKDVAKEIYAMGVSHDE